jgi:serine/threonine protein kinase
MLKVGDIIENKCLLFIKVIEFVLDKILKKIGKGGFGNVYLVSPVLSPTKQFALKLLDGVTVDNEVKIGLDLSGKCSFLVKTEEVIAKDEGLIIVMEYCGGGDLAKRIEEGKPPSDIVFFFK